MHNNYDNNRLFEVVIKEPTSNVLFLVVPALVRSLTPEFGRQSSQLIKFFMVKLICTTLYYGYK